MKILMICLISFVIILFHISPSPAQECIGDRYLKKVFSDLQYTNGVVFTERKENAFGRSFRMVTDIYEPKGDTAAKRPFVVLIHGGAHRDIPLLDRRSPDIGTLAADLARRGYVVFSPEYRLVNILRYDVAGHDSIYTRQLFHSILDIDDLFCFLAESYANGNPYRIDLDKAFMGGVSSGAIITTLALLMQDTSLLSDKLKRYVGQVSDFDGREMQDFLQNKFCGINILGALCYSTTLLDTQLVRYTPTAWYFSHAAHELTTPYQSGFFLASPNFGITHGPGAFMNKMKALGIQVKADIWENDKHPAFLKIDFSDPLSILSILGGIKIPQSFTEEGFRDLIFDTEILSATLDSTARFCYDLMNCSPSVSTGIKNIHVKELKIFPNPVSDGKLSFHLPDELSGKSHLFITNLSGKTVLHTTLQSHSYQSIDVSHLPDGMYILQIQHLSSDILYKGQVQIYRQ